MIEEIKNELWAGVSKASVWLLYGLLIAMGIVGNISYALLNGKKMTIWQILGSFGLSLFCGVVSALVCNYFGWKDASMFIVPIATLVSDKIVQALFLLDWKQIIADIFRIKRKD